MPDGRAFKVPRLRGSRWESLPGPNLSFDPEWPHIAIYCDEKSHPDGIWLIGMFQVSPDLLKDRNTVYWGWWAKYPTGDGQLIHLNWRRDVESKSSQTLVGHRLYDKAEVTRRLRVATEAGDYEKASRIMKQDDRDQAEIRARHVLECGACDDRLEARAERSHAALTELWQAGVREMSLQDTRLAFRLASRRRC